ncbi:unnamed protein product [Rhizoctonia solani]|uniref:Transmembrane protein n=1 Tax=Rhizoctonia solani TaxID=456999 RepID=A0A8H3CM79_9AGAM|nr:unnamed protein product [Rhizoctonia solani]
MILDVESPPKSPASSGPTVRQISGPSVNRMPVSYATFPDTRHETQRTNHEVNSETRPLIYQTSQPIYDDTEPPAYEDINVLPKASAAQNRFWTRCVAVLLVIVIICSTFYSYDFGKLGRPIRTPNTPGEPTKRPPPSQPSNPNQPAPPTSSPSPPIPSLPPLPPIYNLPDSHTMPFITPKKGRIDLCRPWAYMSKPGIRPSLSDNRPIDKLVYTVPTLDPVHLETSAICLTSKGTSGSCENYDDTYDSIAGKLQVIGADVELPQIEVTIQHGSEAGLDSTAVCLMKKPDENGKDRWVLGLYAWRDPTASDRDALLISMSIVVTLPRAQAHNFSTRLNYFAQVIGPEAKTDANTLVFDSLRARLGQRGALVIRNVTAAEIQTTAFEDTQYVSETRVTKSIQMRSDSGMIGCLVTLVQTEGAPPVQMGVQSVIGAVSAQATLEYPPQLSSPPQYNVDIYSKFSPTMALIKDPWGTNLLRQNPRVAPILFPIIRINVTSHLSVAQASVPPTFYGSLDLVSKHAAIVAIDHAKDLLGRTVSYEPTSTGYQGRVHWAGTGNNREETGFVSATTEYASARLLFLGLDDDNITDWPRGEDSAAFGRLA